MDETEENKIAKHTTSKDLGKLESGVYKEERLRSLVAAIMQNNNFKLLNINAEPFKKHNLALFITYLLLGVTMAHMIPFQTSALFC